VNTVGTHNAATADESFGGVLVTGATGMVGSALCRRLVDSGAQVVALVMDHDPRSELWCSGTIARVSVVSGRLEDLDAIERAVLRHDVQTIFHLGAQTIVGAARRSPVPTFEANVRGTWNVLEVARRHRDLVRRVVVASSDKAYGSVDDLPYREDMPLLGTEPYELSKACADLVTRGYAKSYGLSAAIIRCGNIYGPGDLNWSRIVPGTTMALLRGVQPVIRSDGSPVRDYLYVEDVVDGYLAVADKLDELELMGEAFNLSDEAPLSVLQMYEAVCEAAGRSGTEPLVLGEALGEIQDQYLSSEKARATFGWKPRVGLTEGLARTVEWYRAFFAATP
jgi:CDP-glucose 4,6-dehydratase